MIIRDRDGEKIFEGTDLQGADLQGADLRGADLQGADLQWAKLRGADLRGANLQRADLQGAKLQGADLRGADLNYAIMDFSCLPLHCGTFNVKWDNRFIYQIIAHLTRADTANLSDDTKNILSALDMWKNKFCDYRKDVQPI